MDLEQAGRLQASVDASITGNLDLDFKLGVDLTFDPLDGDDFADFVFIEEAALSANSR